MRKSFLTKMKNQHGFSLIELMVVIAILGILGTFVAINVNSSMQKAKKGAAKTQIHAFEDALEEYYRDNNAYPDTSQGLSALVQKPATGKVPENYPEGGYLRKLQLPKDPWGSDYEYLSPGGNGQPFEVISLGADKKEGGTGFNADISSAGESTNQ